MKKQILLIILVSLLFGCRGIKRGVQDNLFYLSTNPKLNILVNSEFKYVESKKETDLALNLIESIAGKVAYVNPTGKSKGSDEFVYVKSESYLYSNRNGNRLIGIYIQEITNPMFFWHNDHFRNVENKIESGEIIIKEDKYDYCVTIQEKILDHCMITKTLIKNVSINNKCRICISYSHYIKDYSLCEKLKENKFTDSEIAYFNSFIADSEKDFTILDYKAPTSTTSNPN